MTTRTRLLLLLILTSAVQISPGLIRTPGLSAEEVFDRTRLEVSRASNREQIPWVSSSLTEEFSFNRPPSPPPGPRFVQPTPKGPEVTPLPIPTPFPGMNRPIETFRDCPECGEMVVVPAGEFEMGAGDTAFEKPQHRVKIANSFAIGRSEVTFREWDLCFADGGCRFRPDDHGWGRGDRPVINVSWDDTKTFISWLSQKTGKKYRLPSEAEWEYAARGGTTFAYWWGKTVGNGHANCDDCGGSPKQTVPVGSFRPNAFGLFDTAGNAAEWVEDCWNDSYRGAPKDASAWLTGQCRQRVLRGGSFGNKANAVRSASRFRYDVDVRYYANGFRVVRDLQ